MGRAIEPECRNLTAILRHSSCYPSTDGLTDTLIACLFSEFLKRPSVAIQFGLLPGEGSWNRNFGYGWGIYKKAEASAQRRNMTADNQG